MHRTGVGTGGGSARGCTHLIHGRSRMTIDPRIPTMAGAEHVGFPPTRRSLFAPSAKKLCEVLGESHEG